MSWVVASDMAARLEDLRAVLGISKGALATRAGVSDQQMSKWLGGRQAPPRTRLDAWCQREGWPIEIFREGGRMPRDLVRLTPPVTPAGERAWLLFLHEMEGYAIRGESIDPTHVLRMARELYGRLRDDGRPSDEQTG